MIRARITLLFIFAFLVLPYHSAHAKSLAESSAELAKLFQSRGIYDNGHGTDREKMRARAEDFLQAFKDSGVSAEVFQGFFALGSVEALYIVPKNQSEKKVDFSFRPVIREDATYEDILNAIVDTAEQNKVRANMPGQIMRIIAKLPDLNRMLTAYGFAQGGTILVDHIEYDILRQPSNIGPGFVKGMLMGNIIRKEESRPFRLNFGPIPMPARELPDEVFDFRDGT